MADHRDEALIAELRDLAGWLEVPPAPPAAGLAVAVVERLGTGAPPPPSRWPGWSSWWRRRWRALTAAAVAAACVVAVVPPARAAVVDAVTGLLRIGGIEISDEPGPGSLPATPSPLPSVRSAALDEARRVAKFPVRAPLVLGPPENVELADPAPDGAPRVVTLTYRGGTVRLDQCDGAMDLMFFKKGGGSGWEFANVDGETGAWVPGPHAVTYVDRTGEERTATARLAGPTLIWTSGDVTYRLEGVPTLAEALAIAESMT
jgi:hypothetical protein